VPFLTLAAPISSSKMKFKAKGTAFSGILDGATPRITPAEKSSKKIGFICCILDLTIADLAGIHVRSAFVEFVNVPESINFRRAVFSYQNP